MSLYDDEDDIMPKGGLVKVEGWSKGVKLMQSQMQLKKAQGGSVNRSRDPFFTRKTPSLAPVVDLKSKKSENDAPRFTYTAPKIGHGDRTLIPLNDTKFSVVNEYDPLWPNEYEKVIQEMRGKNKPPEDEPSDKKRRYTEAGRDRARERFQRNDVDPPSGFGRRPTNDEDDDSPRRSSGSSGGAAIAPPPSLTESSPAVEPSDVPSPLAAAPAGMHGLGIAAKIMAKYGYKQGQGLGRSEQGISSALHVEKTSKRGGRIIHEKDLMPPPPIGEFGTSLTPPPGGLPPEATEAEKPSITDLMKNPSKVVLCKNMVGPGEVDEELEPEVKEECNTKYGDVSKVIIFEIPSAPTPEEAVRIFIEFKRVESAIKAVVDLNGRFFGGREVRASFYDVDKFANLSLND